MFSYAVKLSDVIVCVCANFACVRTLFCTKFWCFRAFCKLFWCGWLRLFDVLMFSYAFVWLSGVLVRCFKDCLMCVYVCVRLFLMFSYLFVRFYVVLVRFVTCSMVVVSVCAMLCCFFVRFLWTMFWRYRPFCKMLWCVCLRLWIYDVCVRFSTISWCYYACCKIVWCVCFVFVRFVNAISRRVYDCLMFSCICAYFL